MHLNGHGHPLHTRALAVVLVQRADAKLDALATLLDVRKRGFVPVGGDLHGPGILHYMLLRGVVDPATATLESIVAEQPRVAFEPSALTQGESCRDPLDRITTLGGTPLGERYTRGVSTAVGGPRGCPHIVALAHFMGSAVRRGLEQDQARYGTNPVRRAGERVFCSDLIADGNETADGRLAATIQLAELHLAPSPAVTRPMDRFAGHREVRLFAEVGYPSFEIVRIEAAERLRTPEDIERADWRNRSDSVAQLTGVVLLAGGTAELIRRFGEEPADRPLLDALLLIMPTLIQCAGTMSESWPLLAKDRQSLVGIAGIPDSCYMWRRGGALHRARRPDDLGLGAS